MRQKSVKERNRARVQVSNTHRCSPARRALDIAVSALPEDRLLTGLKSLRGKDRKNRVTIAENNLVNTKPSVENPTATKRAFSYEIHGARGLALTMVVAFHLFGQGRVSGGVDVFLVISAYLMTSSLIRSMRARHLSLVHRYGRTLSRLLPAALTTIVATMAVGLWALPRSKWLGLFAEGRAAALFQENVYLATEGLSYEAAGDGASPFQHFWSLSMQGQFLLLWPLLALTLMFILKKLRPDRQVSVFALLVLAITVWSFTEAMEMVVIDQPVAYYSLASRMWEFGLGALAALGASFAARFPKVGGVAGWMGVTLIASSGFVVDGASTFPGPWALWPVGGALLVLFAADSGGAAIFGLTRVLSAKPIVWLADRGYPLYLWHWPILVFYLARSGENQVTFASAWGILAVSLMISELTSRLISAPSTKLANRLQETRVGAVVLLVGLAWGASAVAGIAEAAEERESARVAQELESAANFYNSEQSPRQDTGAFSPTDPDKPLTPAVDVAPQDVPAIYDLGCVQDWRDEPGLEEVLVCPNIPGENAKQVENPKKVVVTGSSHVTQFYPAFREIADEEGWELIVIDKKGCRLAIDGPDSTRRTSCIKWNEEVLHVIADVQPDAVITLGTVSSSSKGESIDEGMVEPWRLLSGEGIPVLAIRDSPRFSEKVPACLEAASDHKDCDTTPQNVYSEVSPLEDIDLPDLVFPLDFTYAFCDEDTCPAIIGNVVAYRDASHVTNTFASMLTPYIRAEMMKALPELFK